MKASQPNLAPVLEQLYADRSQQHLANDPLSFCHRYRRPEDQEVAALIAATFAYGNVRVIKGSLNRIFSVLGDSPADFVDSFDPATQSTLFEGFKHRFNNQTDLSALLWAIGQIRRQHGSIQRLFACFHSKDNTDVTEGLSGFCQAVLNLDYPPLFQHEGGFPSRGLRFLFPAPAGGSACKRLCMFLRWVARPADGIDLGLWQIVRPAQLIIPVDRHIERIGRLLGFTSRATPDWRMAREITAALRCFDPDDPVKYDFSICHLGISEGCNGKTSDCCQSCPVAAYCAVRNQPDC